jgi:hypothetical protein
VLGNGWLLNARGRPLPPSLDYRSVLRKAVHALAGILRLKPPRSVVSRIMTAPAVLAVSTQLPRSRRSK